LAAITVLILLALLLAVRGEEASSNSMLRVVNASEILDKIQDGKPVEYDHIIVKGDLDLSRLHLRGNVSSPIRINDSILYGLVSFCVDLDKPINLSGSYFAKDVSFEGAAFRDDASFIGAAFMGNADFFKATFSKDAWFQRATFIGDTYFESAAFNGQSAFIGATFNSYAGFYEATFKKSWFTTATFRGNAQFNYSIFKDYGDFREATFKKEALFSNAVFGGDAWFEDAKFQGKTWFRRAMFTGNAHFISAVFSHYVRFDGATFKGEAWFREANFYDYVDFGGTDFRGYVDSSYANFSGYADFYGASFSELAYFRNAIFHQTADFKMRGFGKDAFFDNATFMGDAIFNERHFYEGAFFENAIFYGKLSLTNTRYNKLYIRWNTIKYVLAYDDAAYMYLIKNFKELGYFEDSDNCYYQYRQEHRARPWNIQGENVLKFIDFLSEWSYGYGVRPMNPLISSVVIIILFGLFWRMKGIGRLVQDNDEYDSADDSPHNNRHGALKWLEQHAMLDALSPFSFSLILFLSAGKFLVDPPELPEPMRKPRSWTRRMFDLEKFLGGLFLALFFIALNSTIIRAL
jgi:uncharacterized protein YjbI with pentapeptide repeats